MVGNKLALPLSHHVRRGRVTLSIGGSLHAPHTNRQSLTLHSRLHCAIRLHRDGHSDAVLRSVVREPVSLAVIVRFVEEVDWESDFPIFYVEVCSLRR